MATDQFAGRGASRMDPPNRAVAVTPSDSTDFTFGLASCLYIGTAGDVVAVTAGGDAVTFKNVQAGTQLVGMWARVNTTNTTASNIVAQWNDLK